MFCATLPTGDFKLQAARSRPTERELERERDGERNAHSNGSWSLSCLVLSDHNTVCNEIDKPIARKGERETDRERERGEEIPNRKIQSRRECEREKESERY
ncbi:unnamed protein product [Boreogadus saida]